MGSTNGTYLNGRQLRTAERLKMADKVRIGDTEYRYEE
jgi:pSer/pThr/pTyr-binding forkhead associated (FHA) protein